MLSVVQSVAIDVEKCVIIFYFTGNRQSKDFSGVSHFVKDKSGLSLNAWIDDIQTNHRMAFVA